MSICLIMALMFMSACSNTDAAKKSGGSAADTGSVSGNDGADAASSGSDTGKVSGTGDAADATGTESAQPAASEGAAPGGETKAAAWSSDAAGDVVDTVDLVAWHEKYYLMEEDTFFDTIGVDKKACENEPQENSNLYTLPGLYTAYGQLARVHICTIYGEVRNISVDFMYDDGLEIPFELCKSVIKTMDGLYERQGEASTNYLDTSESVEDLKRVFVNDLNMGGMVWVVDDDEWVMLEIRNSGEDTYVAVTYKFNNAGLTDVILYGRAYDPTSGESIGEVTSIMFKEYSDNFQLRFFYEGIEYQFDIAKTDQRTMGDYVVYESISEYNEDLNSAIVFVTDEQNKELYAGMVRVILKDTTKGYNENDILEPFGFIIADSPTAVKDALGKLETSLQQDKLESSVQTHTGS